MNGFVSSAPVYFQFSKNYLFSQHLWNMPNQTPKLITTYKSISDIKKRRKHQMYWHTFLSNHVSIFCLYRKMKTNEPKKIQKTRYITVHGMYIEWLQYMFQVVMLSFTCKPTIFMFVVRKMSNVMMINCIDSQPKHQQSNYCRNFALIVGHLLSSWYDFIGYA